MTIGCTRCGATSEGDIIVPALAFGFKHNEGCGHGVGPLAVLPGNKKAEPPKIKVEDIKVEKDDIKVEVKEVKPKHKFNNFSNKEKKFG